MMADNEITSRPETSDRPLPPLRIHHILAATVTAAVLLSLHEVLRGDDVLGFAAFFRSGHGIAYTVVTALSCTLTIFGVWWRHQGLPYFRQPGHWLLLGNSLAIGMFLFAALATALRWDAVQLPYSVWMAWYVAMSLLSAAVNFWAARRAADTRWWKSFFVISGGMALFMVIVYVGALYPMSFYVYWLGGIATTILLLAAVISDRRARRSRDWPHWSGAGLDLMMSAVAIGQLGWQWFSGT
jgi:hypothetical protein